MEAYGISAYKQSTLIKFSEKNHLSYSLLGEVEKEAIRKLGERGKKKLYSREYEGIILRTFILDGENIVTQVFPWVSHLGHAAVVLERLGM